jgi:hypothetical protein
LNFSSLLLLFVVVVVVVVVVWVEVIVSFEICGFVQ